MTLCAGMLSCSGGGGGNEADTDPAPTPQPPSAGLDQRPDNTTCLAGASPSPGTIRLEAAFGGRTFAAPLGLLQAPADDSRWYVLEQAGRVRDFDATSTAPATTFVDISAGVASGGEMGLLGMAFHPQYASNGRVYLSYTHRPATSTLVSRISRFDTFDAGNGRREIDPGSEQILLTVTQPFDNHNGGHIAFGPDGFLYIGFGDGGSGGDPQNNAQQLNTVLGKLLRIDVNQGTAYAIPADNPFAGDALCSQGTASGGGQCPEIYAYGLRNPWRWSFDRANGTLWLADVGQNAWEEVNIIQRGGNYGWNCREGAHAFNSANCPGVAPIDPVAEYPHTAGNLSITGGFVYRGPQPTPLQGRYLFADFGSGRIWTPQAGTLEPRELNDSSANIASFGESNTGELYIVDLNGPLSRIVFAPGIGGEDAPAQLSATGCVDTSNPAQPAAGLIPYAVNAPFWSDGAEKDRWLAVPNGTQIAVNASGDWTLPTGSVLMKHFRRDGRLIETRLLLHHTDDQWTGVTYEWNDAQTAATRVQGGVRRTLLGGGEWLFPSESECLQCHTAAAGHSLGLHTAQLNRDLLYPQTQRTANQIDTLGAIAVLNPTQAAASTLAVMPNPADATASLPARARAWLHTNCSHCHRPGGSTTSAMDLRYETSLAATQACDVVPNDSLGLADMRLIAPGAASRSMIVNRAARRDVQQMPPIGSLLVDQAGVALVSQWIDGMSGC